MLTSTFQYTSISLPSGLRMIERVQNQPLYLFLPSVFFVYRNVLGRSSRLFEKYSFAHQHLGACDTEDSALAHPTSEHAIGLVQAPSCRPTILNTSNAPQVSGALSCLHATGSTKGYYFPISWFHWRWSNTAPLARSLHTSILHCSVFRVLTALSMVASLSCCRSQLSSIFHAGDVVGEHPNIGLRG